MRLAALLLASCAAAAEPTPDAPPIHDCCAYLPNTPEVEHCARIVGPCTITCTHDNVTVPINVCQGETQ